MAAQIHRKVRNHLRKTRFAKPLEIDEDVTDALLKWKFGEGNTPSFYLDSRSGKDCEEKIISEAGEEWLLQNKALADQFLQDNLSSPSSLTRNVKEDRYSRLFDDDLKRNACYPTWPKGSEGLLPPLVWLWAFWYKDSLQWAWRIFWFLVLSHLFEVVLVLLWLTPVTFTYPAKFAWTIYAFFCGWPITGRTKILSNIVLQKEENKELSRLKKAISKKET